MEHYMHTAEPPTVSALPGPGLTAGCSLGLRHGEKAAV